MTISRRNLLSGLTAGAALPWLGLSAARAAATSSLPAVAAPHPLDENHPASHVGNLIGPIARIRDAYGWATESFTSARYRAVDHPAWRSKMLDQVFAAMYYAPAQADFAAETVEKVDCGPFVREKIYFNTTPELRVPAYVLVPKVRRGRVPGVVTLHDHGAFYRWGKEKLVSTPDEHPSLTAFKKTYYAGRSIADDLAAAGHVVIAIDMFYWGERRLRLPEDPPTNPRESDADVRKFNSARGPLEQLVFRTIATAGFTWAGLIFWDDLRTLDYLAARPEVDPERLGCVGLSVGGWRAAHLTALDRRIKAGVDVCWLTSFKEIQADHVRNTVGFTKILPGLSRQLDMPDVVSLAAPRPLLCINGLRDKLFSVDAGVQPAYDTLRAVYAKLGAAEKFRGHLYDTPHEFNADMQGEAWGWLKRWL